MRSSFRLRAMTTMRLAAFLLAPLVTGCSRAAEPEPPPVLSTWAEQAAAAERAVEGKGQEFVLVGIAAQPVDDKGAAGEPLELRVYLFFAGRKESQLADENVPQHDGRMIIFNDHRLATTLKVEEIRRSVKDEPLPGGLGAVRVGPQDVLKTTRSEGEAYMGKPVDRGNILLRLARPSAIPSDLTAPFVWYITYYRQRDESLGFMIDPQTGTVLKRETKTAQGQTEAAPSPSPKP